MPDSPTTEVGLLLSTTSTLSWGLSARQERHVPIHHQTARFLDLGRRPMLILGTMIALWPEVSVQQARGWAYLRAAGAIGSSLLLGLLLSVAPATALGQNTSSLHAGSVEVDDPTERALFGRLLCRCGECARMPLSTCTCSTAETTRAQMRARLIAGVTPAAIAADYVDSTGARHSLFRPTRGDSRPSMPFRFLLPLRDWACSPSCSVAGGEVASCLSPRRGRTTQTTPTSTMQDSTRSSGIGMPDRRPSIPNVEPSGDLERRCGTIASRGLPLLVVALAVVAGAANDLGSAILVLAGGMLLAVIGLLWASIRILSGDVPITIKEAIALGAPSTSDEQKRSVLRALKDSNSTEASARSHRRTTKSSCIDTEPKRSGCSRPWTEISRRSGRGRPRTSLIAWRRQRLAQTIREPRPMARDAASRTSTSAKNAQPPMTTMPLSARSAVLVWHEAASRDPMRSRSPGSGTRRGGTATCVLAGLLLCRMAGAVDAGALRKNGASSTGARSDADLAIAPGPGPRAESVAIATVVSGQAGNDPDQEGDDDAAQAERPENEEGDEQALPPGHPPVGGPGPSATAGSSAVAQDSSQVDRNTPPGTVVVDVRDHADAPVALAKVELTVIRHSVEKGEARGGATVQTDSDGTARFSQLATGSAAVYRISVPFATPGGVQAVYGTGPFRLDGRYGQHVVVHVLPATDRLEDAVIGMQGMLYIQLKDDAVAVEELFEIYNLGQTTWVPSNLVVELPHGFKAFQTQEQMSDAGFDEVPGRGARLHGTFAPGQRQAYFRFRVPYDGGDSMNVSTSLPPHVARMKVIAEAAKSMTLDVDGFPPAFADRSQAGQRMLAAERQLKAGDQPMQRLHVRLEHIPGMGKKAGAVASAAALIMLAGLYLGFSGRRAPQRARVARRELEQDTARARTRLVAEIAALEEARAQGAVGPKTYERLREALLEALGRLLEPGKL